jgi:hypothetical protein
VSWDAAAARSLREEEHEATVAEAKTEPKLVPYVRKGVEKHRISLLNVPPPGYQAQSFKIDWARARELYVDGELDADTGWRTWPSQSQVAERVGVSTRAFGERLSQWNWKTHRARAQEHQKLAQAEERDQERVRRREERRLAEAEAREEERARKRKASAADAPAPSENPGAPPPQPAPAPLTDVQAAAAASVDPLSVVDGMLAIAAKAVAEGKPPPFGVADYERAVKLRSWLLADAATRAQAREAVSLESLQLTHRELREREALLTPEQGGTDSAIADQIATTVKKRPSLGKGANRRRKKPYRKVRKRG